MRSRLLLLSVLLLTGCGRPYDHRPPLQVAARAAKAATPLSTVERVESIRCDSHSYTFNLWGVDRAGRPLAVMIGKAVIGTVRLDQLPWEEAQGLVRAAGYTPVKEQPRLAAPSYRSWLVTVQKPDFTQQVVQVKIPSGELTPHGLGEEPACPEGTRFYR